MEAAKQAVIRINQAAASGLADARHGALTSYEALTTPGAEPFDKLRAALSSEDEQVRIAAAVILGKVTTAPTECVPLLIKALDDPTLQRSAVLALGKMGPERTARTGRGRKDTFSPADSGRPTD